MLIEAHAKINWTLEILGTRPDGYHELKSIVLPVSLHDDVEITEGATLEASDFPYGEKDLAYRAARLMQTVAARPLGARFKITKRIPAGGGLGGGSADAAAVINGLNEFWQLGLSEARRIELAAQIGSDVPALVVGAPVLMEGRGERVRRLTAAECATVPPCEAIELLMPPVFSSTAAVYGAFRAEDRGLGRNDLQPAALRLYPEIAAALEELKRRGLRDVAMSGSGSTVYGVRDRSELERAYNAYVDTFRGPDGELPPMMELKRVHTGNVLRNAQLIADGEHFTPAERAAAEAAALLHDTGRYEQLKRYNTFRDSASVDHAVFSHDLVREFGWLDGRSDREAILKAVLYHNRRELPEEIADPLSTSTSSLHLTSIAAHTVRDADKLDIFRVLESLVSKPNWREDRTAFWNLDILGSPNPEVVRAIAERRPVDYQNIKTLADFVLIQVGWMISGLHFATSRRLCAERGHLEFRRRFLHTLTDDPSIDRLCDMVTCGQISCRSRCTRECK